MAEDSKFKYVLIPADDALPFQELEAEPVACGDTLSELLKRSFAGGVLANVDELRKTYGAKVDEKMGELQAHADAGTVEMLILVRTSKTTLPKPNCQTSLYYDEMGALKGKPSNMRAGALARQCGLDLEHPLLGDVFVGRVCCDPGPISVNFESHELDSSSPWIAQAPAENAAWKGVLSDFNDNVKSKTVGAKTAEEEEAENVKRGWRWTQSEDEVEITLSLPEGTAKGSINVAIGRSTLRIALKAGSADPLIDLKLLHPVSTEDSTWTMGSDARGPHVQVTLAKEQEQMWAAIDAKIK